MRSSEWISARVRSHPCEGLPPRSIQHRQHQRRDRYHVSSNMVQGAHPYENNGPQDARCCRSARKRRQRGLGFKCPAILCTEFQAGRSDSHRYCAQGEPHRLGYQNACSCITLGAKPPCINYNCLKQWRRRPQSTFNRPLERVFFDRSKWG
jgi:hypothetical protein